MPTQPNPWYLGRPYSPIFFVVFALLVWYVFQLLARAVITCLPGGDACLMGWAPWPLTGFVWPIPGKYLYDSATADVIVSLTTLALALWPAIQIFFPESDPSSETGCGDETKQAKDTTTHDASAVGDSPAPADTTR